MYIYIELYSTKCFDQTMQDVYKTTQSPKTSVLEVPWGAMLQFIEGQYRAGVRYGFQAGVARS
jgi:hypothetical protein